MNTKPATEVSSLFGLGEDIQNVENMNDDCNLNNGVLGLDPLTMMGPACSVCTIDQELPLCRVEMIGVLGIEILVCHIVPDTGLPSLTLAVHTIEILEV